jgi:acyl-CoA reductase-like NAD-dependent aldehyde dehydrogenase
MSMITDSSTFVTSLYVDGDFRTGSAEAIADLNPATESHLADVEAASPEDVDVAVRSARAALAGEWGATPGVARALLLHRLAELIERDGDTLARLEALDVGKPVGQPAMLDVPMSVATLRYYAGWADKITGQTIPTAGQFGVPTLSYTLRQPVGVVAAIVPWNSPLMLAVWKIATALAAGNTVIVKPPEAAPLSILHLAKLVDEAGFPGGVVNFVPGAGAVAGEALVTHEGVDKISFTGSAAVGRRIGRLAAETFKRVTLELGGKSPQIILPDADLEAAIGGTAMGLFFNQGEVCAAGTRVLAHRSVYEQVVEGLAAAASAQVVGDPFDPSTTIGPLVNAKQRDTVQGYIERGNNEGARMVAGGNHTGHGYFVRPTVFADATNEMVIAREEIFGPVGTVIPFDDPNEAVSIANDTRYGLAASIWTRDVGLAHNLARRVSAGAIWVNGWGALDPALPWGGLRNSGVGRELGWSGIEASTEEKVVTVVGV